MNRADREERAERRRRIEAVPALIGVDPELRAAIVRIYVEHADALRYLGR